MRLLGMGNNLDGRFTANLISLQLQLKTLLEDAGGDGVVRLLDALCKLSSAEQQVVLAVLAGVVDRIAAGELRLTSERDQALKLFEENLYRDLVNCMREASTEQAGRRLEVVRGGKSEPQEKRLIDINNARSTRKNSVKPVLN